MERTLLFIVQVYNSHLGWVDSEDADNPYCESEFAIAAAESCHKHNHLPYRVIRRTTTITETVEGEFND